MEQIDCQLSHAVANNAAILYHHVMAEKETRKSEPKSQAKSAGLSIYQRFESLAWIPLMIVVLLAPWAWVKVLACCGLIISLRSIGSLSRSGTKALTFAIFAAAYLLSPYWGIPVDAKRNALAPEFAGISVTVIAAALLFVTGIIWSRLSAGEMLSTTEEGRQVPWAGAAIPALLAAIVMAINFAPFYYSIPVNGDEDWHMMRLRMLRIGLEVLFNDNRLLTTILGAIMAIGLVAFLRWPALHVRLYVVVGLLLAAAVLFGYPGHQNLTYHMVRYPYLSCWLHLAGAVWNSSIVDEGANRMVPLVSTFAIGYFILCAVRSRGAGQLAALLAAVAMITVPNIYYHATSLYLEMPAVALMTVALAYVERLVRDEPAAVRTCPGWYALLAAGFVKETLTAILMVLIIIRLVVRLRVICSQSGNRYRAAASELVTAACMALPLGLYLLIRMYFGDVRGYSPNLLNLTNAGLYAILAKALWSQFGLLLVLACGGLLIALRQKRFLLAGSLVSVFVADLTFHFLDLPTVVGLARFDLMLFAPLAVMSMVLLQWLANRWKPVLAFTAAAWIALNFIMSPIAIGGEKKPYWTTQNMMTCDFYFPKEEAVAWLKQNRPGVQVVVGGAYSQTNILWYFAKLQYETETSVLPAKPDDTPEINLQETIRSAEFHNIPLVLYFRMTPGIGVTEAERTVRSYHVAQVFSNRYMAILLYEAPNRPR